MIRSPTGHKSMAVLETLSNDDVDAKDDALKKINLYFTIYGSHDLPKLDV